MVIRRLCNVQARDSLLDNDPGFGALREPILKLIHFLRAMEYAGLLSLPPAGESDGNGNSSTRLSDDEAIAAASVHAGRCLLIDDSVKNIVTAKKMGWCTVLIGKVERDTGNAMPTPAEADHHVSTIHEIVDVLPALFEANEPMAAAAAV